MKIQDSTALVTGANRGIGYQIVKELLERGARRVYATSRSGKLPNDLASEPRVRTLVLDSTDPEQVAAAAAAATDIDLLVNNAGTLAGGSVLDADIDVIRRDLETNYLGTLNVLRAFVPSIRERDGERAIVNVLSLVSLAGVPSMGGYSASKAAALAMTQSIRAELAPEGISVHAVFPGPVDTEMAAGVEAEKASPSDVARRMVEAVESGAADIFPDPMSTQMQPMWEHGGKQVETAFASFG